jgi:P27 family predicted phage terminase small subunit
MSERKQTKAVQAQIKSEPVPILECPPELGPAAREEWQRIVAELIAKGVLSRFDRGPLAAYCTAFALAMEAAEMVHKHGAMIKSPNGFPMQSPYLSHLNQQVATMMRIAGEFGFTPASRSRIFSWDQKNSLVLDGTVHESDDMKW